RGLRGGLGRGPGGGAHAGLGLGARVCGVRRGRRMRLLGRGLGGLGDHGGGFLVRAAGRASSVAKGAAWLSGVEVGTGRWSSDAVSVARLSARGEAGPSVGADGGGPGFGDVRRILSTARRPTTRP